MAVKVSDRSEAKLEALEKTFEFVQYTLQLCNNEKIFPKRHRWYMTARIANAVLECYTELKEANDTYVNAEDVSYANVSKARSRLDHEQMAKDKISEVLALMQFAYEDPHFPIESKRMNYWTHLCLECKKLIQGYADRDRLRFGKIASIGISLPEGTLTSCN